MLTFWTRAMAEAADGAAGADGATAAGGMISSVLMIVAMVAIMYFLMIRPQKKKEKQVKNMLDALKPGDKICTIGGLYGTILSIKDDNITITLGAQQNTVVIAKWAVRSVEDMPLENDKDPEI